jgi:hypothetical protein
MEDRMTITRAAWSGGTSNAANRAPAAGECHDERGPEAAAAGVQFLPSTH